MRSANAARSGGGRGANGDRRAVARLAPVRATTPVSPWPDLDARAHAVFGDRILTPGASEVLAEAASAGAGITQAARETFYGGYAGYFPDIVENIRGWMDGKPVRVIPAK